MVQPLVVPGDLRVTGLLHRPAAHRHPSADATCAQHYRFCRLSTVVCCQPARPERTSTSQFFPGIAAAAMAMPWAGLLPSTFEVAADGPANPNTAYPARLPAWQTMRLRCLNPENAAYPDYAGEASGHANAGSIRSRLCR